MRRRATGIEVIEALQGLWALAHALEARSKWMHRELGITGPQRLLVRAIGEAPGCSAREASMRLSLDPGTVSRLVVGLERARLVERHADAADGRRFPLVLTARGRRVNALRQGTVEAAVRQVLGTASRGEARQALTFIRRLTEQLTPSPRGGLRDGRRRPGAPRGAG
jgi:DNA-binding MarR family transcriptional regulator